MQYTKPGQFYCKSSVTCHPEAFIAYTKKVLLLLPHKAVKITAGKTALLNYFSRQQYNNSPATGIKTQQSLVKSINRLWKS
jgi:hypothetical protein